jgi:hypothetical protein
MTNEEALVKQFSKSFTKTKLDHISVLINREVVVLGMLRHHGLARRSLVLTNYR